MLHLYIWCSIGDYINGEDPYYWYSIQAGVNRAERNHRCSTSSAHPNIVMVSMADGSVCPVNANITVTTWIRALHPTMDKPWATTGNLKAD